MSDAEDRYELDDFRVTLTRGSTGGYDVRAVAPDGSEHLGRFDVPLSADDFEQAVLHFARGRERGAQPDGRTREVAPADADGTEDAQLESERLGAALGDALLGGAVGVAYDAARQACESADRGLRLTMSLTGAPLLLSLPWELLYRRPRFIASQRHTPLVRQLDAGSIVAPRPITDTVRILGVVSSPSDLAELDVAAERQRVEQAMAPMVQTGLVQLDWLEPATPKGLREALRDNSYDVLHYVGHSSFTAGDEGAIYLEAPDGAATEVDNTALALLLADQDTLRLVVLNSCEGARTTLDDPYAGVATTLIQLGVPAVVAMQFEISDAAAIVFAAELYVNLIDRHAPIDVAVSEARKAIYIEVSPVEWATPVLFVHDPEMRLFDFRQPVADSSNPPPAEGFLAASEPPPPREPARRRVPRKAVAGIAAALILGVAALVATRLGSDDHSRSPVSEPAVTTRNPASDQSAQPATGPRPRTGFLSAQILEGDGDTHLFVIDPDGNDVASITQGPGISDTEASWDPATNRLAFTRVSAEAGAGSSILYAVPGNLADDQGRPARPLVPWDPGEFEHLPAWTGDGRLFYLRTDACEPAPTCAEELRIATFDERRDPDGYHDGLTFEDDEQVEPRFVGVTAVAADPTSPARIVVADKDGLWLVDEAGSEQLVAPGATASSLTFTADGQFLVALVGLRSDQHFDVYTSSGDRLSSAPLATATDLGTIRYVSITADSGRTLFALSSAPDSPRIALISQLGFIDDHRLRGLDVVPFTRLPDLGEAVAIAH